MPTRIDSPEGYAIDFAKRHPDVKDCIVRLVETPDSLEPPWCEIQIEADNGVIETFDAGIDDDADPEMFFDYAEMIAQGFNEKTDIQAHLRGRATPLHPITICTECGHKCLAVLNECIQCPQCNAEYCLGCGLRLDSKLNCPMCDRRKP